MQSTVFTFFKKYKLLIVGTAILLLLSGCGQAQSTPLDPNHLSFFEQWFVYPLSISLKAIASFFNDSYGLSIIIITIVIRLILMPFMVKQTKSSMAMKDKMAAMKPELDELKKKYANKKDQESVQKQQQEMMQLYQKHNMNPLSMFGGCLPMLIQMPILIGFFYAIKRTPEIASHGFLWFNLGQTDLIMVFVAVVIYYLQYKVQLIGLPDDQRKQMAIMGIISPIMIGFVSLNAPAALPLYWATGGLFLVLQTLVIKKFLTNQ